MYIKDVQKYNIFIYESERDASIKDIILHDMGFSTRLFRKAKWNGEISLVNKALPKNLQILKGDIIKISLPDDKSYYKVQKKDLKIYFEDDDIMIVEKPPFVQVHPTGTRLYDTLLNYMLYEFEKRNIHSKPRFISRLDYNTSGLITIAKNPYSHYQLSEGDLRKSVKKYYRALVHGHIEEDEGVLDFPIGLGQDGIRRCVTQDGKRAVTLFKKIREVGDYTLVEFLLKTGRTHQIRVHMKHIGHPVLGDDLYGYSDGFKRQVLHASRIELVSPRSLEKVVVESDFPDDIDIKDMN